MPTGRTLSPAFFLSSFRLLRFSRLPFVRDFHPPRPSSISPFARALAPSLPFTSTPFNPCSLFSPPLFARLHRLLFLSFVHPSLVLRFIYLLISPLRHVTAIVPSFYRAIRLDPPAPRCACHREILILRSAITGWQILVNDSCLLSRDLPARLYF